MSESMDNLERLKSQILNGGDEQDQAQIAEWEKELKRAMLKSNLLEHDGIKLIFAELDSRIDGCNALLMNDRSLTPADRDKLFERRDAAEWFKSLFTGAKSQVQSIDAIVRDNLNEEK